MTPRGARGTRGRTRKPPAPRTPGRPAWWADPERRWRLGLLGLFATAAAWRCAYLVRLSHTPFAGSLNADSGIYWEWSESILRQGLMPASPFFLAPLYPYLLAAMRAAGASLAHVLAIQALLGAAAVALLAAATGRLAGRPVALTVGVILALFQPTTFFDGLVLPESVLFFIESLLVWFVVRTDWARASMARYPAYGLLVGVLAQGRASNAVLLALVVPLAWARRSERGGRLAAMAAAAAVFLACCLPSTLANWRASHEPVPFTYNLGFNLYVGNNPDANGAYVDITGGSLPVALAGTSPTTGGALDGRAFVLATEGRRLSPAESSAYWARKAMAFARSAPLRTLALAGKKLLLAWNRGEVPQIESMESFSRAAGPLGLPLVGTFGFLAILGLAGVAWAVRGGPAERWLVGYVALVSLALAPFFVTDRYRHHLVPALALLAGIALARIIRTARVRTGPGRVGWLLPIGLAAAIVCAPIGARHAQVGDWVFVVDHAMRLLERGAYAEAAEAFGRAETALGAPRTEELSISERTNLAAFYFRYGIALEALGRGEDAIARWERAVLLNPRDAESLSRLTLAYERAARAADAANARRMLGAVTGGRGHLLVNDGWAAAERGDLAAAERLFLEALQAVPDLSVAWEGLIRIRIQTGRLEEAARALEQARAAGLQPMPAEIYEGFLAVQRGDLAAARRAVNRIPSDYAPPDPVLAGLLEHSRRALGGSVRRP
jgi:Flp pilus assembly protein TadD/4-amino-4-deoxy-L-arabinose transferase-like glycosyltransferase